jgi:C1A family cysteine protease
MADNVKRKYGWTADTPDFRDLNLSAVMQPAVTLPPVVDLRTNCSPVEDQGAVGSCTANALVGAVEYLMIKDKHPFVNMSRLFIYYNERAMEGTVGQDAGAQIRDGIKTLAKKGVCSEKLWPYVPAKFKNKPTKVCYKQALDYQITAYARLNTLDEMLSCLASGFPFTFGFSVYESFESQEVARTGVVNMPSTTERMLGGHAVLAVGYRQDTKRFLVRNSWSQNWGQKGYFTMPFDYLSDRNLSDDAWVIRMGEQM